MNQKAPKGFFAARLNSFANAFRGWKWVVSETNFRIHLLAMILVSGLGIWLGLDRLDWGLIIIAFAIVTLSEALNTALEYLCDVVSPEHHPLIGKAKDVAAGAVLIAALFAILIAIIVFGPYLLPS